MSSKIQREVVGIAFMHDFHAETSSIQDVCPRVDNMPLAISDGLIEVESIEIECHGGDAEGGKPDTHDGPRSKEEVETAAVIKRSILKNKTTKISMCCYDVICFFFLSKLIPIVERNRFGRLPNQGTGDKTAMHSTEQTPTKYAGNTQHMETMHKNIMFSLKDEHVVERTGNAKRHAV